MRIHAGSTATMHAAATASPAIARTATVNPSRPWWMCSAATIPTATPTRAMTPHHTYGVAR